MKANKILCPVDFSENSKHALEIAGSLARESGGTVLIVHVEPFPSAAGEMYYGLGVPAHDGLRKALRAVLPPDSEVRYEHKLLHGDAASRIVDLAKTENVDLIVMGTHGRTGLKRLLMGSVAEVVVRRAPCPVLTVGTPAAAEVMAE